MKQLNIQDPNEETVKDWYNSAMDVFRDNNWLGTPDSSIELHLLSGTKDIDAQSFERLEPLLDNLRILGCVKDISHEEMLDLNQDETYRTRRAQIDMSYAEEGNWEMSSYLKSLYEAVPDTDVSLEFFSTDASLSNLNYNTAVVEDIEESMIEDQNFAITGIELSGYYEANFPEGFQTALNNSIFFDIHFLYGGDEDITEEYNQVTEEWGDHTDYAGIPGVVKVGGNRPIGYFFDSQEISADGSEVDEWLYDNLNTNLGSRSKIRNKT